MGTWIELSDEVMKGWKPYMEKVDAITDKELDEKIAELNSGLIDLNVEISVIQSNIRDLQGRAQGFEVQSIKVQGQLELAKEQKEWIKEADEMPCKRKKKPKGKK